MDINEAKNQINKAFDVALQENKIRMKVMHNTKDKKEISYRLEVVKQKMLSFIDINNDEEILKKVVSKTNGYKLYDDACRSLRK